MVKGRLCRLEDFIALAREGKKIQATIDLKKRLIQQKVHPEETDEMKGETEMYLLLAVYSFKFDGDLRKIAKVYVHGSAREPLSVSKENISVANERLKMDYGRLRKANIEFEEKYF
ncbi:MAG: hypothetical protein AB1390_01815 [Nitrospirota bacterium]